MAFEVLHKSTLWALPLLDGVCATASERELGRVGCERSDTLLMVGEDGHGFAGGEIPEADVGIEGACDYLRVRFLALHVSDGGRVARENVDVASRTHVPNSGYTITASCDQKIQCRMNGQCVNTAQMTMIVPNDLVRFQIPTFHHLVLSTREQVRMPW